MSTTQASTPFPFDEVEEHIDGAAHKANAETIRNEAYAIAAKGAHEYIRWLILGPDRPGCVSTDQPYMPIIAKRAVAAAWVISPALFAGKAMSEIARAAGMEKSQLSRLMLQFEAIFRTHGRGQMPVSVRGRYARKPIGAAAQRRDLKAHHGATGRAHRGTRTDISAANAKSKRQ